MVAFVICGRGRSCMVRRTTNVYSGVSSLSECSFSAHPHTGSLPWASSRPGVWCVECPTSKREVCVLRVRTLSHSCWWEGFSLLTTRVNLVRSNPRFSAITRAQHFHANRVLWGAW
jgi:hypothetical protein